ncbi:MAG: hypothetical protein GY928_22505 [Colwellia sp.]|nr:hypothetical protein [Colwellia sp.]
MKHYLLSIYFLIVILSINTAVACNSAQLIDYDYQAKEILGNGYSTFGRLWGLDGQEVCGKSLKYTPCLIIKPRETGAELQVKIVKNTQAQTTYTKQVKYNQNEVIRFDFKGVDVYLKLFVSNTIADLKMSGKSCLAGFPNLPRHVTREELDNMFKG